VYDHPIFELESRSHTAEPLLTEDGSKIRIIITNRAPSTLEVDKVQVCLVGQGQQNVWYTSDAEILTEGENEVVLTSLVSVCFRLVEKSQPADHT
jgi:hypothetical protein